MNPIAERIIELIIKHLNGELNEAERLELQDWINQSEENCKAIEDFLDEEKLQAGISNLYKSRERIWQRLHAEIPNRENIPVRRLLLRYAAAAAILVMVFSLSYYFLFNHTSDSSLVTTKDTAQQKIVNDVSPGGDRAVLTLADGSLIVLDSAAKGTLAQQGHSLVIKSDQGQLAYQPEKISSAMPAPLTYNTLATPRGGQYQLQLPDGSKVWLNAFSSLRFPTAFAGNERTVQLTGEAYFEIAKDATRPFFVNIASKLTGEIKGKVEVLGTHFNINAYDDEESVKTTLFEGSVKMSNQPPATGYQRLVPGQQARMIDNKISLVDNADIQEAIAWKDGLFQFTEAGMPAIMRQISRWYDVEVEYEGAVPAGHITGKMSRNMNLSNVLRVLELSGMHFTIANKKVVVLP